MAFIWSVASRQGSLYYHHTRLSFSSLLVLWMYRILPIFLFIRNCEKSSFPTMESGEFFIRGAFIHVSVFLLGRVVYLVPLAQQTNKLFRGKEFRGCKIWMYSFTPGFIRGIIKRKSKSCWEILKIDQWNCGEIFFLYRYM